MKTLNIETNKFIDFSKSDQRKMFSLSFKRGLMRCWIESDPANLIATVCRNSKSEIVGWALSKTNKRFATLTEVDICCFVQKYYRRRGIGKALVLANKEYCKDVFLGLRFYAYPHSIQGRKIFADINR